jgi:hypothetical protein
MKDELNAVREQASAYLPILATRAITNREQILSARSSTIYRNFTIDSALLPP